MEDCVPYTPLYQPRGWTKHLNSISDLSTDVYLVNSKSWKSQNLCTRSTWIKPVAWMWILETLDHVSLKVTLRTEKPDCNKVISHSKNPNSFWRAFLPAPVYLSYQFKRWKVTGFNNQSTTSDSPVPTLGST